MYNKSDLRYVRFSNKSQTKVDFELNHKNLGWIPYTLDINNISNEIEQNLKELIYKHEIKNYEEPKRTEFNLKKEINKLTVTTSKGNVFDANSEARQNMCDAIIASETLGQTETIWVMADFSKVKIDIKELREAHALALLLYAKTKEIL